MATKILDGWMDGWMDRRLTLHAFLLLYLGKENLSSE
jgi:hypothetical protein